MATLLRLKQDIQFNGTLGSLLNVLKSIATQQFQTLERRFKGNDVFFQAIQTIAAGLSLDRLSHPFTTSGGPMGVIAVTSDTGLLGGLNRQVVATSAGLYRQQPGELMVVGARGRMYAREYGIPCENFPGIQDEERHVLAAKLREHALTRALAGHFSGLAIVYPRALSFTAQRVEVVHALPCQFWLKSGGTAQGPSRGSLLLESTPAHILEYAVWMWLGHKLTEVFGYSRLAELGARAMHLEGSSQELQRRGRTLRLQYFKKRHELIDASMRELFAARSLYGG